MGARSKIALVALLQIGLFQQLYADKICQSQYCKSAAERILSGIDNKTEPCDDFYQFSCGRWLKEYELAYNVLAMNIVPNDSHEEKLRALLEMQPGKDEPPIMSKVRDMYASCMNESHIEARGDKPLLDTLASLGGWPVLMENSASYNTSWLDLLGKFRELGLSHDVIIDCSVRVAGKVAFIELDSSSLRLPAIDHNRTAYYEMMVESALMLGANRTKAESQMLEAYEFEVTLVGLASSWIGKPLYNETGLHELAPNIDWQGYFDILSRGNKRNGSLVAVRDINFIVGLDYVLKYTDRHIVANYMIWRVVRASMKSLSKRWLDLEEKYEVIFQIIPSMNEAFMQPRWLQCLNSLHGDELENEAFGRRTKAQHAGNIRLRGLSLALSALFAKHYFKKESITVIREIANKIREEFSRTINDTDWLDNETRAEAQSKLQNMLFRIGYPDELLQDDVIENYYRGLEIKKDDFYSNVKQLNLWSINYAFNQLGKPIERNDWRWYDMAYSKVVYSEPGNSINIPAWGSDQLTSSGSPNYLSFSTFGYAIGHEITHGFDSGYRQLDKDGHIRDWWTADAVSRFNGRAQCLIDQYANYALREFATKVDGERQKLDENIADNGGIKHAFKAYQRLVRDNGEEDHLPDLDYMPEQLFWISYANSLCRKYESYWLEYFLTSDPHPPPEYMVKVTLSNLPEFAQTFNCLPGSPMNPVKKCSVW